MKNKHEIKKILIAVDETPYSEKAWLYGHHLAQQMKAKIALVHVNEIPAMPTYVGNLVVGEAPTIMPDLMSIQEENTQKLFEKITKSFGPEVQVDTFSRMGAIREEILDVAQEWEADLIILGTHGRTGFDHFISGSVAESVARRSDCPVLIIPNKEN
jgi:nucleotide-binding universal stress UspA family protein